MDTRSEWINLNLSKILPSSVPTAAEALKEVLDVLEPVLSAIVAGLDLASAAMLDRVNVFRAAMDAAIALVDAAIEAFVGTSISVTWHLPVGLRAAPTPSQALRMLAASYHDENDRERPIAITEGTHYATVVVMSMSTNWNEVHAAISGVMELFGLPLGATFPTGSSFLEDYGGTYPPKTQGGQGAEPNWRTVRLADLGALRDLTTELIAISDSLRAARGNVEFIARQISAIRDRISLIASRVDALLALLQRVAKAADDISGLPALVTIGSGDTQKLSAHLSQALSFPGAPQVVDNEKTAFFVMHAQAGGLGDLQVFLNLLSIAGVSTVTQKYEAPSELAWASKQSSDGAIRNPWEIE